MSTKIKYKQCTLSRGDSVQVAWLPEKFAKKDKYLMLKQGQQWCNGWKVTEVDTDSLPECIVVGNARDYTRQRKASDI